MKFFSTLGILCLCLSSVVAQNCFNGNPNPTAESFNMTLLAQWDDDNLPSLLGGDVVYNDIWGYAAPDVNDPSKIREYAIIGSVDKIHIFDITDTEDDPNNLVEIANFTGGGRSIWRDFKTNGHYAYCVADQNSEGLIILDLSDLPNSVTEVYRSTEFFNRTHNIFIENDRLYVVGQSGLLSTSDAIVLDISDDKATAPELLGDPLLLSPFSGIFNGYVHDVFVKDNIAYCSHIEDSVFALWDFTIPSAPTLLSAVPTDGLQHSSWLTEDGNYSIYAEETSSIALGVVDVSDPTEIQIVHNFKKPLLEDQGHVNNIAHNPFIKGNYLYVSYYEDGVQVFDISDPTDPSRVGWYDTQRCNIDYNGTDSNWGVYPFYDSKKIVASDTRNGLFVIMMNEDLPTANNDALPVELAAFTGELEDDRVRLNWITHSEAIGVQFFVEKQVTTNNWNEIASLAGKGVDQVALTYTSYDDKPQPGNNYYRLAQQDIDGKITYSETVVVNYTTTDVPVFVYPTLLTTENALNIVWNEALTTTANIQLFAANGQLIKELSISNITNGDVSILDTENLGVGVYTLRIQGEGIDRTERVVKM